MITLITHVCISFKCYVTKVGFSSVGLAFQMLHTWRELCLRVPSNFFLFFFYFFLVFIQAWFSYHFLLVFHSRPVRTVGPPSVGGSSQRPFSLLPLPGLEPRQAQCKQQVPTP